MAEILQRFWQYLPNTSTLCSCKPQKFLEGCRFFFVFFLNNHPQECPTTESLPIRPKLRILLQNSPNLTFGRNFWSVAVFWLKKLIIPWGVQEQNICHFGPKLLILLQNSPNLTFGQKFLKCCRFLAQKLNHPLGCPKTKSQPIRTKVTDPTAK